MVEWLVRFLTMWIIVGNARSRSDMVYYAPWHFSFEY